MAVRPFYITAKASGRSSEIGGGPKSKDGYMETTIYQRDQGEITSPFKIIQRSVEVLHPDKEYSGEYELITEVYYQGELIKTHSTAY